MLSILKKKKIKIILEKNNFLKKQKKWHQNNFWDSRVSEWGVEVLNFKPFTLYFIL